MLRSAILRGPAQIAFNGATFYSKGDISMTLDQETFEIMTSMYGIVDRRIKERKAELSFEPVGEWEASGIAALWNPYSTMKNGTGIFGLGTDTDLPLVINTVDKKQFTFRNAAVTKLPDLILSATKTMIGSTTMTCIGKNNTPWNDATGLVEVLSGIDLPASALDASKIQVVPWIAAWGSSPWDSIETVDGWVINFNLTTTPIEVDSVGIMDHSFDRIEVIAKAKPVGITEAQLITALGLQGTGAIRGRSEQSIAGSNDLLFTPLGGALALTIFKPAPIKGAAVFGPTMNRLGEVEFHATRKLVGGVMQPLFTFA